MTANLLTLNSSKTEFHLTGLKNNLQKFTTPHSVGLPLTQLRADPAIGRPGGCLPLRAWLCAL